jgi:hypothetical protein
MFSLNLSGLLIEFPFARLLRMQTKNVYKKRLERLKADTN